MSLSHVNLRGRYAKAPATLALGQGQLFPVLEEGIKAMAEGETKSFEIACADAYGARSEEKIQKLPASPEELEALKQQVTPGKMVQLPNGEATQTR
jgi:FKBP-type peptidyl-prolyl cis-trans isomerase 2